MLMKTIISKDARNSDKFRSSICKARSVIHQVLVVGRVLPNLKMGWHGADYTTFCATFHVWFCLLLTTAHGMDILQMKMQSLRAGSRSNSHTLLFCARSLISELQSWNLLGVASTCRTFHLFHGWSFLIIIKWFWREPLSPIPQTIPNITLKQQRRSPIPIFQMFEDHISPLHLLLPSLLWGEYLCFFNHLPCRMASSSPT